MVTLPPFLQQFGRLLCRALRRILAIRINGAKRRILRRFAWLARTVLTKPMRRIARGGALSASDPLAKPLRPASLFARRLKKLALRLIARHAEPVAAIPQRRALTRSLSRTAQRRAGSHFRAMAWRSRHDWRSNHHPRLDINPGGLTHPHRARRAQARSRASGGRAEGVQGRDRRGYHPGEHD